MDEYHSTLTLQVVAHQLKHFEIKSVKQYMTESKSEFTLPLYESIFLPHHE